MPAPTVFHGIGGRGGLDIVDAQLHLAPQPDLGGIATAMDALGIRSVLFDELWGRNEQDHGTPCIEFGDGAYRPLSPLAQAAALQDPQRFAWLQRVTRRDPGLASLIPQLGAAPGCKALRVVIFDRDECGLFRSGAYDALLSQAQEAGLALCLLARDAGALLESAAARFPRLRFVVDHCGWVRKEAHWREVLALARHDNVWLKWSHFHRAFGDGEVHAQGVQGAFEQALGAFGARRVLWAGDVTHEETSATWAELLAFVLRNPALNDADREWVLGGAAREVFRWAKA
ncbi:amidohydrolase family protein [Ramlibacter sp. G-1-2-2]|uniref:Amidohydrolase family protein n=1 Tax=Ramlibacter agri TaxID=2728837 RepID=A0A848H0G9_9BURK|nr:amidohydrolase family protein [Ramlibacter agri]NML44305.1 amidohydrolase family protein [Ramlibacter agri]